MSSSLGSSPVPTSRAPLGPGWLLQLIKANILSGSIEAGVSAHDLTLNSTVQEELWSGVEWTDCEGIEMLGWTERVFCKEQELWLLCTADEFGNVEYCQTIPRELALQPVPGLHQCPQPCGMECPVTIPATHSPSPMHYMVSQYQSKGSSDKKEGGGGSSGSQAKAKKRAAGSPVPQPGAPGRSVQSRGEDPFRTISDTENEADPLAEERRKREVILGLQEKLERLKREPAVAPSLTAVSDYKRAELAELKAAESNYQGILKNTQEPPSLLGSVHKVASITNKLPERRPYSVWTRLARKSQSQGLEYVLRPNSLRYCKFTFGDRVSFISSADFPLIAGCTWEACENGFHELVMEESSSEEQVLEKPANEEVPASKAEVDP